MNCHILIKQCAVMTPDFKVIENQSIAIDRSKIIDIANSSEMEKKYKAQNVIEGKGKLAMPGLIDAHTHVNQQYLRGRTTDEFPMVWTRILVPFESNLGEEDVYHGTQLACLEMIKSGTTTYADAGGSFMHRAAQATIESGMRAVLTNSIMDKGEVIPEGMKNSPHKSVEIIEQLHKIYNASGEGRVKIWFSLRQIMTSSHELIEAIVEKAKQYNTGIHIHLAEHRDEVSYCLQHFHKRPAEFLDSLGALGPNLLAAHCVLLSDNEIGLLNERNVKIVHCPRSNFGNHGFPKTPRMMHVGLSIGLGSDGASASSLSLWDEMRVFCSGIAAFWGLPIVDPVVLTAVDLMRMATVGGAQSLLSEGEIGALEIGKKADIILINIDQPHISPTHKLINTMVETINGSDVSDSIIDGKIVMKNRVVLTLDEERILFESKKRLKNIATKSGI